ncbi:MAG TPA: hypothetical protein VJQ45_13805, partial [Ktedonobacterales bacterium]|nr:hypothetical protein [Ktedonobacterales bacterium]
VWALYAGFGLLIFVPALLFILPGVLANGVAASWGGLVVLVLSGAVVLGSLVCVALDLVRWARAGQYLIVMTPDDYVKQEPGKVTHVPMAAVADPTVKGLPDPGAVMTVTRELQRSPAAALARGDVLTGAAFRTPRRAPSLAFRDRRTDTVVVVATDAAFDDLWALYEILGALADDKARELKRARGELG